MSDEKKEQASRNPFAKMLEEIQEDNELRKEYANIDAQTERLHSIALVMQTVYNSLEERLQFARKIGSAVANAMESVDNTLLETERTLGKLERYVFPARLDDKSIAQLNEKYNEFHTDQTASIEDLKQDEKKILEEHREELKALTKQHGLWLSDKNYYLAIAAIVLLLALFYLFGYLHAGAKIS